MPNGVSDELTELHARRARAEKDAQDALGLWAFETLGDVTFAQVRSIDERLRGIISQAVIDAYNIGVRHARKTETL